MTEKNIFAYKLFLPLNISDFNLFLCENCNPSFLKKVTPSFPATPVKVKVLSSPFFLKIWLEAHPPTPFAERGGAHYVYVSSKIKPYMYKYNTTLLLFSLTQINVLMKGFLKCMRICIIHKYILDIYKSIKIYNICKSYVKYF